MVVRLIPFLYLLNTDFNGSFSSPTVKLTVYISPIHLCRLILQAQQFCYKKLHVYNLKAFVFRRENYSIINEAASSPPKLQ